MFKVNCKELGKSRRFPWKRKTSGDKQKGPSKEERKSPIIGQALLPDVDLAQERRIRPLIGPIRVAWKKELQHLKMSAVKVDPRILERARAKSRGAHLGLAPCIRRRSFSMFFCTFLMLFASIASFGLTRKLTSFPLGSQLATQYSQRTPSYQF